MGGREIINFLKQNKGRKFTSKEIKDCACVDVNLSSVNRCLARLSRHNIIYKEDMEWKVWECKYKYWM